jgi:membrane fusion protein (multidrug efflux system)
MFIDCRLVAGLLALLLCACGEPMGTDQAQAPAAAPPPPVVGVIEIKSTSLPLTRDVVGRLAAFRSADVRARVAGILLERAYAEGTDVILGDLLFRFDPAALQGELNRAVAQAAQAEATLTNDRIAAKRARELAP